MSLFDTGIRPAIDDFLLKESQKERDYGEYWSASSAGYCMRRNIFNRLGVPQVEKDNAARKQRVFTSGHIFHEWIQGLTKEAGLSIAQEVELQDEDLMIRGHFDDLVLVDDNLVLYDYKTQNSRAFTYQKGRPMSYYHRMQLGTYMLMLRKETGASLRLLDLPTTKIDVTEARILKISKDDLRMDEDQILWSAELEADVTNYWKTLNKHWEDRTIPPCTCADHEGGFLAKEQYNDFYYNGEPCSLDWYLKNKKEGKLK